MKGFLAMTDERARSQDIRPLRIRNSQSDAYKNRTETQLLRLIGNSPITGGSDFVAPRIPMNPKTLPKHILILFYQTFEQVRHTKLDGLIITGAPCGKPSLLNKWITGRNSAKLWSGAKNVFSTSTSAGVPRLACSTTTGIQKNDLPSKMFGVFQHFVTDKSDPAHPRLRRPLLGPAFPPYRHFAGRSCQKPKASHHKRIDRKPASISSWQRMGGRFL